MQEKGFSFLKMNLILEYQEVKSYEFFFFKGLAKTLFLHQKAMTKYYTQHQIFLLFMRLSRQYLEVWVNYKKTVSRKTCIRVTFAVQYFNTKNTLDEIQVNH